MLMSFKLVIGSILKSPYLFGDYVIRLLSGKNEKNAMESKFTRAKPPTKVVVIYWFIESDASGLACAFKQPLQFGFGCRIRN